MIQNDIKSNSGDNWEQDDSKGSVFVTKEQEIHTTYNIHIDDYIYELDYFRPLESILSGASENDTVKIHLSCNGGSVHTALTVYNWLMCSEAKIVVVLHKAISGGTFFLLAADQVVLMPHSFVMVHSAMYGSPFDDQQKVKSFVEFHNEYLNNLAKDIYRGFMSEKEISDMLDSSKEFWMDRDEVENRMKNKFEYMKEWRELNHNKSDGGEPIEY